MDRSHRRGRPLKQVALLGLLAGWTYALLTGWWVYVAAHYHFGTSRLVAGLFLLLVVGPICGVRGTFLNQAQLYAPLAGGSLMHSLGPFVGTALKAYYPGFFGDYTLDTYCQ